MSDDVDPLAVDEGVPRDWLRRPLIIPAPRGKPNLKAKLETYTRASTFAKTLSDGGQGLTTWQVRHATLGIALRPDLAAMAAALGRNLNDYTPEDKRNLDAIVASAHDTSGGNDKANWGTAVHSLTEDPLVERGVIDDDMAADVNAYDAALLKAMLEPVSSEQFVVNDELKVAGTYDHKYRLHRDLAFDVPVPVGVKSQHLPAGTILVGDKKTGTMHWTEVSIQLAIYARGKGYDHTTGERTSLDMSPQWGIVAHIPKGKGEAILYLVDLHAGWELAKIAAKARAVKPSSLRVKFAEAKTPAVCAEPNQTDTVLHIQPAPEATPTATSETTTTVPNDAPVDDDDVVNVQLAKAAEFNTRLAEAKAKAHADATAALAKPADEFEAAVDLVKSELGATEIVDPILTAISAAPSSDEVTALWRATVKRDKSAWLDAHTDAAKARLAELKAA